MWAVSPIQHRPIIPLIPKPTTNSKPPLPTVLLLSANFNPKNGAVSSKKNLISALNSSSNNTPIPKQEERQLSGSDVLWALQRVATQKNKKNKKKRESSSTGGNKEEDGVDCSNLRPLRIKSEWGVRLNELEKRLQQLSDIT